MLQTGNFMAEGQTQSEDRSTFGMWAIASSPLILSYNLSDAARNERAWSIITNQDAIAVNQAWAGDAGHLVLSWDPNSLSQFAWLVRCDDSVDDQNNWFYDETAKELKYGPTSDPRDDLCLDLQLGVEPALLKMSLCRESRSTHFVYDYLGRIVETVTGKCITALSYDWADGPGLVLQDCAINPNNHDVPGKYQAFSIGLKPRHNMLQQWGGNCLAVRSSAPYNSNKMQVWAKKIRGKGHWTEAFDALTGPEHLPHIERLLGHFGDNDTSSVQAVLVVNADKLEDHTISFTDALLTKIFGDETTHEAIEIYDIWMQKNVSLTPGVAFGPKLGPRDAGFYLIKSLQSSVLTSYV